MQILGLSESTPKPENRLRNLFWPRIRYIEDVDTLGTQGYWVCIAIAVFTLFASFFRPNGAYGIVDALYFFLAGVGVRRRSRFAAVSALVIYLLTVFATFRLAHSGSVLSIFFLVLLLSNVRGTWLAAYWVNHAPQPPPLPLTGSLVDKFTDVLPRRIWPIGRWLYYSLTVLELAGLWVLLFRGSTGS